MVISHQKWKSTFLESLMNLKHERLTLIFFDFGIALKEFEIKICNKVIFGSFWKKLIFGSFDFRGVFWELQKNCTFSGEGYFWENCS